MAVQGQELRDPVMEPGAPAGSWVNVVLRAACDLEESLADPTQLDEVVALLSEVATVTGTRMVTGASPLGHQLAGVLAGRAEAPLALWAQNGARGTVLVIEGVLASGAQMTRTARRAREAGADRVIGAAVLAEPRGLATCRRELGDDVRALHELVLSS